MTRIGADTIQEIARRDGKVTTTTRFTVSSDGRTLTITMEDAQGGRKREFLAHKL